MKELAVRYAVGALIFNEKREYLVLKRNPLRYVGWGLVKGGIDEGENALQALEREIMEEIGVQISLERVIDLEYKSAYYDNTKQQVGLVEWFMVLIKEKTPLELQLEEWVDYKWVPYDEAWHKLTWQTQQMTLKKANSVIQRFFKARD